MALDKTPWFVGGGAQHSPEVARLVLYAGTGGAEGVASTDGLKVTPQAVANGTVRVMPGAALLRNRYAGGSAQTYAVRNPSATDLPVTATGSAGGRTDLVVARVLDSQYEGQPPTDPTTFDYSRLQIIEGVPAGTRTAEELGLTYPAVALARITLPASTGTVTAAHITDVRTLAQPRSTSELRPHRDVTSGNTRLLTSTAEAGEQFPPYSQETLLVPEWATRMQLRVDWIAVHYSGTTKRGEYWVSFGPNGTELTSRRYAFDPAENGTVGSRDAWLLGDQVSIPASMRGRTIQIRPRARIIPGTGDSGTIGMDLQSAIVFEARFQETIEG